MTDGIQVRFDLESRHVCETSIARRRRSQAVCQLFPYFNSDEVFLLKALMLSSRDQSVSSYATCQSVFVRERDRVDTGGETGRSRHGGQGI